MADEIVNLIITSDIEGARQFTESLDQVGAASQAAVSRVDALGKSVDDNTQQFVYSSRQINEQNSALRQIGPSYDSSSAAIMRLTRENDQLQRATQGVQRMMDTQNLSTSVGGQEIAKYAARQAELSLATDKLRSNQSTLGQLLKEQPGLYGVLTGQLSNATRGTLAHGEATEGLSVRTRVLEHALTGMVSQLSNGISPVQAIGSELGRLSLAFRAFEFILSPIGIALTAVGAAAYVLHNNFTSTEDSVRHFKNILQQSGDDVPGLSEKFEKLAVTLSGTGVSLDASRKVIASIIESHAFVIDEKTIAGVADFARRLSELDVGSGALTEKYAKDLPDALKGGYAALRKFADDHHLLTDENIKDINKMINAHATDGDKLKVVWADMFANLKSLDELMGENEKNTNKLSAAWAKFLTDTAQSDAWQKIEVKISGILKDATVFIQNFKFPTIPENKEQWGAAGKTAGEDFINGFLLGVPGDNFEQNLFATMNKSFQEFSAAGTAAAKGFIDAFWEWFKPHLTFEGVFPFNLLPKTPSLPQGQLPGEALPGGPGWQPPSASAPLPPLTPSPQSYNFDQVVPAATAAAMTPWVAASLDVFRSGGMATKLLPLIQTEAQAIASNSTPTTEAPVTAANSDITEKNTTALKDLKDGLTILPDKIAENITTGLTPVLASLKTYTDGMRPPSAGGTTVASTPYPGAAGMATITLPTGLMLPASLVSSVIQTESSGYQYDRRTGGILTSDAGAMGLMQVTAAAAKDVGFSPADIADSAKNVEAGTGYLVKMLRQFGDLRTALEAYNFGPGNMQKVQAGLISLPKDVAGYATGTLVRTPFTGSENLTQLAAAAATETRAAPPALAANISPENLSALAEAKVKNDQLNDSIAGTGYANKLAAESVRVSIEALDKYKGMVDTVAHDEAVNLYVKQQLAAWTERNTKTLGFQSEEQARVTGAINTGTDALQKNTLEGLKAEMRAEAQRQSIESNISVEDAYAQITERNSALATNAIAKQIDAQKQQIIAAQAVAAGTLEGAKAAKEAEIQNQATLLTQDAVNKARLDGKTIDADRIASFKQQAAENLKQNEILKETTQLRQQDTQIQNQIDVSKLEESLLLQGKTSDEIRTKITLAQAYNQLVQSNPLAEQAELDVTYKLIEARELENQKVRELRQEQARLNEEIRSIADTVINTLGGALDKVLSGQKIADWGALFKQMMQQIASTIIQTEILKPLIGSALTAFGAGNAAQQYGTLGSGGGLLSGLGSIGKFFGLGNDIAGAATGGSGGIFGGISDFFSGTSGIQSASFAKTLLETPDIGAAATVSTTALSAGAAEGVGGGLFGGVGSAIGSAIPYIGPLIAAIPIISSLVGPKPSTQASGNVISLTGGGVGDVRSSGNAQNDATSNQISSTLSSFLQNLQAVTGGGFIPGTLNVQATTKGIKTSYSGPLGNIDAQFADAQTAITQFELAFLHNIENVSDTLKTVLSHVTDPAQLDAAIAVAKAYDNVATAFDSLFSSIEDATKQVGPYSKILDQINTQYGALIASAQQYGLSIEPIATAYSAAQQRLIDDFNKNISDAMSALTDPFTQAMNAEKAQASQRLSDATAIGADITNVEKFNQANLEKIALSASASLGSMAQHLGDFISTLGDSLEGLFKNIETQMTSVFTSGAGVTQLSGTDPYSQAFNSINTQAEAARRSAIATFANPNVLNTVLDAIQGVQDAAFQRLKGDFEANITDLSTAATNPLQSAITKEVEAGQQRVEIAKATGADLNQVLEYNQQRLINIYKTADPSSSLAGIVKNAADTLKGSLGGVLQSTTGPFEQALKSLNTAFGTLINQMDTLGNSTEDVTPVLKAYADQIDALRSTFNDQIKQATLAITDPVQAALDIERKAGQQRVKDAQVIGGDLAAVDAYNVLSLNKVFDATQQSVGSIADLNAAIQTVVSSLEGPFTQALDALNTAFDKVEQSAAATTAYNDALSKLQDTFNTQIAELTLSITDPVQAALNVERKAGDQRIKDAIAVGGDLAAVDRYNTLSLNKVFEATQAATGASLDYASSLATLKSALDQLKTGSLAGLTPQQSIDKGLADFRSLFKEVMANPTTAGIQELSTSGTGVVQLAEQVYGNAPQTVNIRKEITAGLSSVNDEVKKRQSSDKAGNADLSKQLSDQIDSATSIADSLDAIALAEFKRTGVHNVTLEEESHSLRQNIADWKSQLKSGASITQAQIDRNKFTIAMGDSERSLGQSYLDELDKRNKAAQAGSADQIALNKSLRDQYTNQLDASKQYAGLLHYIADTEFKRTGVHDKVLEDEAKNADDNVVTMEQTLNSGKDITQAELDRSKLKNSMLGYEVDVGNRTLDSLNKGASATKGTSDTQKTGYELALEQLNAQRQISADGLAAAKEYIAAQVEIANQVLKAQKALSDAFTAAVNSYQDILNKSLAANQAPPAPTVATPVVTQATTPPDWHSYHLSTPAGWVGEIWATKPTFAAWSGLGALVGSQVYTSYGDLYAAAVITPHGADSNVGGTGTLAEQWRAGGATVTENYQHGGMTAFPGWALVGEQGPEFLHLPAGTNILPHGISPPPTAPANDNTASEMRRMREELKAELAALRQMTQAAAIQANRDAKSVAGETGALHNTVRFSNGPIRRVV